MRVSDVQAGPDPLRCIWSCVPAVRERFALPACGCTDISAGTALGAIRTCETIQPPPIAMPSSTTIAKLMAVCLAGDVDFSAVEGLEGMQKGGEGVSVSPTSDHFAGIG